MEDRLDHIIRFVAELEMGTNSVWSALGYRIGVQPSSKIENLDIVTNVVLRNQ